MKFWLITLAYLCVNTQDGLVREATVWHALIVNLDDIKVKSERLSSLEYLCSLLMQGMLACPKLLSKHLRETCNKTCMLQALAHLVTAYPQAPA